MPAVQESVNDGLRHQLDVGEALQDGRVEELPIRHRASRHAARSAGGRALPALRPYPSAGPGFASIMACRTSSTEVLSDSA